jgi:hypothetical protein
MMIGLIKMVLTVVTMAITVIITPFIMAGIITAR